MTIKKIPLNSKHVFIDENEHEVSFAEQVTLIEYNLYESESELESESENNYTNTDDADINKIKLTKENFIKFLDKIKAIFFLSKNFT